MQGRRLYVVRHGHREDFVGDEWSPEWGLTHERGFDPPLSEKGLDQARALGQRLVNEPIDHVFASPFLRTAQTAHFASAPSGRRVNIEPGIAEWLHPFWYPVFPELLPPDELAKQYPAIDPGYTPLRSLHYPERVEQTDVWPRVAGATQDLLARYPGNLLLVTHASPLEGLIRFLSGNTEEVKVRTCALYVFEETGNGWTMAICGSTSHLDPATP